MLQPKRLEQLLSHVLDRRTERAERRKSHIAELRKRAAEADAKLKRLYDAIENGVTDLSDPMLKGRVAELKATRDQARLDAERAEDAIERGGAIMHSGVYFNKSQVRIDGPEKIYTRQVEGVSRTISFHFCPTCGSSVYRHLDLGPDHYGIAVGAFADPDFPPPTLSVWEQSRHPWINLPEGMQHFPKARV